MLTLHDATQEKPNELTAPNAAAIATVLTAATETDEPILKPLDTAAPNYAPTNFSRFSPE
jgi:hypothetical protein